MPIPYDVTGLGQAVSALGTQISATCSLNGVALGAWNGTMAPPGGGPLVLPGVSTVLPFVGPTTSVIMPNNGGNCAALASSFHRHAARGFLPPHLTVPEGEGTVTFSVQAKPGLVEGDIIGNSASIVFDLNSPILTAVWLNAIGTTGPGMLEQATLVSAARGPRSSTRPAPILCRRSSRRGSIGCGCNH